MYDNEGLFADPRPAPPPAAAPDPGGVPDWLVANLRKTLDTLGLESMADRQALVVELAGRQVGSLRELTFVEASQVSEKLSARKQQNSAPSTRTSWDDREGDTWIDRL